MSQQERKCPHCGSSEIARSHRRLPERLLFFVKPYRCNDCQRRFYASVSFKPPTRAF
jgi:predicted RNA-binding Zn-ribbon protein involved in translation (DUF1610 family)